MPLCRIWNVTGCLASRFAKSLDHMALTGVLWAGVHGIASLSIQGALPVATAIEDSEPFLDLLIGDFAALLHWRLRRPANPERNPDPQGKPMTNTDDNDACNDGWDISLATEAEWNPWGNGSATGMRRPQAPSTHHSKQ